MDEDPDPSEANRRHWDDLATVHVESDFYDVEAVVDGASSLREIESRELPDLEGLSVLHLQCHIGLDSISLAREGADVTAVDYSTESLERARDVAEKAGVDVRFVESDVRDVPGTIDDSFDLVFASYGVLTWIPDVREWMDVAAEMLAPGGTLYLADYHPFTDVFAWEDLRIVHDYFGEDPADFDEEGSYADHDAELEHTRSFLWTHPLGEIVTGAIDAGLELEFLHEYPHTYFQRFEGMHEDPDGRWWLEDEVQLPQLFSLRATAGGV